MSKKSYVKPQILVEEWKVYKETTSNRWGNRIYEVSDQGRVKINGQLQTEFNANSAGYFRIGGFFVHRAVAELFIPNPENKPQIDHIDTNKTNNNANNLRWVSRIENMNNPLTLQHLSECSTRKYLYGNTKQKQSDSKKGEKNPRYGIPSTIRGKHRVYNDPNNYKSGYHYE